MSRKQGHGPRAEFFTIIGFIAAGYAIAGCDADQPQSTSPADNFDRVAVCTDNTTHQRVSNSFCDGSAGSSLTSFYNWQNVPIPPDWDDGRGHHIDSDVVLVPWGGYVNPIYSVPYGGGPGRVVYGPSLAGGSFSRSGLGSASSGPGTSYAGFNAAGKVAGTTGTISRGGLGVSGSSSSSGRGGSSGESGGS